MRTTGTASWWRATNFAWVSEQITVQVLEFWQAQILLCGKGLAPRRLASDRCTPGLVWPLRLPGAYIQEDVDGCRGLRQQAEVLDCELTPRLTVDDEGYRYNITLTRSAHTLTHM